MICPPCRDQDHLHCPELKRWCPGVFPLGATELAGGQWCDCHHAVPGVWVPGQTGQFQAVMQHLDGQRRLAGYFQAG